jgi:hypothetical protein
MPEVVFTTLIADATQLPPGADVESPVINVSGARQVNMMISIINTDAAVTWTILFGRTTNNGFARCRQGTFGSGGGLVTISIPVFGTEMFVEVENKGQHNQRVDAKVYFIRELP